MKTIPDIVNFFNDDQVFITTENQAFFTFADLKKQIDWTKDFLGKNHIEKTLRNVEKISKNGMKQISNIQKHVVENIQKDTLERKLR